MGKIRKSHISSNSQISSANRARVSSSTVKRPNCVSNHGVLRTGVARARTARPKTPRLIETPTFRIQQHSRRVQQSLNRVLQSMEPFRRANAVPAEGEKLSPHRQRTWRQRVLRFAKSMDQFEESRRSLLSNRSSDDHNTWAKTYGADNPETQVWTKLKEPQLKALETFLRRFSSSSGIGLEPNILDENVSPASDKVLMALSGAIRSIHGSIDSFGAANIDHLATVYKGVLEQEAARKSKPLSQAEVDKLAFNTVCTDVWMKGQSLEVLSNTKTARTSAGNNGGEIYDHMKNEVAKRFEDVPPNLKMIIQRWINRGFVPMDPQSIEQEAKTENLSSEDSEQLKSIWGQRIMASGDFFNIQSFMLGVWLHGLPSFDSVKNTVESAGKGNNSPQEVYYAVLGHHMAGFIAAGFARGNLQLNFSKMESEGEIPSGAADKLSHLYESSVRLAAKWRSVIDSDKKLSPEQRSTYRQDATELRAAVSALPEEVRTQLLNDDEMQFTPVGIEKWINMTKGDSNANLISALYEGPVQAYFEEQLARDINQNPGQTFISRTEIAASKLGVELDNENHCYRLAEPGEPAFQKHAETLMSDRKIRSKFEKSLAKQRDSGLNSSDLLQTLGAEAVVDWFRTQSPDPNTLVRLAQS